METCRLGLAHCVLLGMCLGFGLSSAVLAIIVAAQENPQNPLNSNVKLLPRSKRDLQDDPQTPGISHLQRGTIDVISNADPSALFADDGAILPDDMLLQDTEGPVGEHNIHVVVLSEETTLLKYAEAIKRTWGAELPEYQLIYGAGEDNVEWRTSRVDKAVKVIDARFGESYGYTHLLHGLHHACAQVNRGYHWFVLARDAVYINPPALHGVLDRLSYNDPIIMGVPVPGQSGLCELQTGAVFSRQAMDRLCPRLHLCDRAAQPSLPDRLADCIFGATGISCLQGNRLLHTFHVSLPRDVVSPQTAFIGPMEGPLGHYQAHLTLTQLRIHAMQQNMAQMRGDLSWEQTDPKEDKTEYPDPRSKRESVWNDSDDHIPFRSNFLNKTKDYFRQFIDGSSYMYRDSCLMRKYSIEEDKSYKEFRQIADHVLKKSIDTEWALTFGYKLEKHKHGLEYDFFYIEPADSKHNHKVHQVTLEQTLGSVKVLEKEKSDFRDMTIITSIPRGYADVHGYLDMVYRKCEQFKVISHMTCAVVLFVETGSDDVTATGVITHFKSVHPNFKLDFLQVTTEVTFPTLLTLLDSTCSKSDLLVFLPVDSRIDIDLLLRCQMNTELHKKVYFPVGLHTQLDPDSPRALAPHKEDTTTETQFWINRSFDTFSAHLSDIQDFQAQMSEARDVYWLFVWAGFEVGRVAEPSLQLNLDHMCQGMSQAHTQLCLQELKYINMV